MENPSKPPFSFSELAVENLMTAARWAKVYGWIVCLISGFTLLMFVISLVAISTVSSFLGGGELSVISFVFLIYILFFSFLLYLNYQLVGFGKEVQAGVGLSDAQYLEKGFGRLSRYFKIISILMICLVVVSVLFFILTLAIGGWGALMAPDAPVFPEETF